MSHRARRGTWKEEKTRKLVHLKETICLLVNWNTCSNIKYFKKFSFISFPLSVVHRFVILQTVGGFNLKQFNHNIRIPHLFTELRTICQMQYSVLRQTRLQIIYFFVSSFSTARCSWSTTSWYPPPPPLRIVQFWRECLEQNLEELQLVGAKVSENENEIFCHFVHCR